MSKQDQHPHHWLSPHLQGRVALAQVSRTARLHGAKWRRQRGEAPRLADELASLPTASAVKRIRAARGRLWSPYLVELLIQRSGKVAPLDAREGLRLISLSSEVLENIPQRIQSERRPSYWLDIRASIEAERGNALRIMRKWKECRLAFRRALAFAASGSGDAALAARLAYLLASQYLSRKRIRAALVAVDIAVIAYQELESHHQQGEAELKRAYILMSYGSLQEAVRCQIAALSLLDESAQPVTALAAYSNLAEMMQRNGEPLSALTTLDASQHLAESLPDSRVRGAWFWIRGRCRIASGAADGEGDLRLAWQILESIGDTYNLGLVGLDLCSYYLDSCNLKALERWVGPAVQALGQHAPSSLIARELAKLEASAQRLTVDTTQVGQTLLLVREAMSKRGQQ